MTGAEPVPSGANGSVRALITRSVIVLVAAWAACIGTTVRRPTSIEIATMMCNVLREPWLSAAVAVARFTFTWTSTGSRDRCAPASTALDMGTERIDEA